MSPGAGKARFFGDGRLVLLQARPSIMAHLERVEQLYLDDLMALKDAHEGIAAFIEKRAPEWCHG